MQDFLQAAFYSIGEVLCPPLFEPKPRFNFALLVLSLLLAAGALSRLRKSLRDTWPEMKKRSQVALRRFSFVPAPVALSHFRAETEI
ncbi:MAG: hypothetical protein NC209_05305 [Alistipes sp.]|nr:hypothetical protein [Alistipes senegalensis]MCM1250542.1 hypothetical protein [Alistipes sp.]